MLKMWQRVIGIVGGLGPHAHIEFERQLLATLGSPAGDQEYPEWIVVSVPHTPDRTKALLESGPSPVPALLRALERLDGNADFAVITCMTAHAFLDEICSRSSLPILDVAGLALTEVGRRFGGSRIGVLATTGALRSGIYSPARSGQAAGVEIVSLLDLPEGERLQEELVMRPIYGPLRQGRRLPGASSPAPTGIRKRRSRTARRLRQPSARSPVRVSRPW